jgi:hypothetical protein
VQVYIGDKVVLTPVSTGQPLHVSDLSLPDHPDCREVNADPAGELTLFDVSQSTKKRELELIL